MSTSLIPPAQWAQNEFGFAQLGDQRRNKRLVNIAEHLAARPGGMLPQAFGDWAELKAAYRFFGQRGVSFERVMAPHVERTRQACRQPGDYLLIEDTTLLDYSRHGATGGLGVIGVVCVKFSKLIMVACWVNRGGAELRASSSLRRRSNVMPLSPSSFSWV